MSRFELNNFRTPKHVSLLLLQRRNEKYLLPHLLATHFPRDKLFISWKLPGNSSFKRYKKNLPSQPSSPNFALQKFEEAWELLLHFSCIHTHTRFIPSKRTHVRNETELARLPCNKPRASLPRLALCIDPGECQERAMVRSRRVAHDPGCTFRATLARCGKLRSHLRSPAMPANDLGLARMGRSLGCRSMQPCNSR